MTPDVSAIVVSHRSAAEAEGCVASLREAFAREALDGEVVLVDCGSGEEERERLRRIAADAHVLLDENRGYSGGVNAGLARARSGTLLVSNADVVFFPGAVTLLSRAAGESRVGAAAPLAVWDAEGRLKLPPGFAPGFLRDLAQLTAGRSSARDDRRFAAFAREALRLWRVGGSARHLSGAVLAARRAIFDRAGRFDERFPFEYEETEWQARVLRAGFDLRFLPQARVRHLWAVSASRNPETGRRRAQSERLYRRQRYGRIGRFLLERAARSRSLAPAGQSPALLTVPAIAARPGAALAISPNPSRIPFAVADLDSDFRLPDEIAGGLPAGPWYFTVFRAADGRPLETRVWEKTA